MSEVDVKVCRKCHLELPVASFTVTDKRRGYRKARCKSCESERIRAYYAANESYRADCKVRSQTWSKGNPHARAKHQRKSDLKYKYDLSTEQYDALLKSQDNKCALCKADSPGRVGKNGKWKAGHWHIDHCHEAGHVRGLLCHKCNVRVGAYEGLMKEIGAQALVAYLTRPSPVVPKPEPVAVQPPRYVEVLPPSRPKAPQCPCVVDGCGKEAKTAGYCGMHYARLLRNGDAGPANVLPRATMRGGQHPKSKLTADDVLHIKASQDTGAALALKFGVTRALISRIRLGKTWAHVNPETA